MTAADQYISRVLAGLPRATPMRQQIAVELRGHIAERVSAGSPVDSVLHQLGDPARLAESYLSAVPMESAPFVPRILAKLADIAMVALAVIVPLALTTMDAAQPWRLMIFVWSIAAACLGFIVYAVVTEFAFGQTLGKRIANLHVVRESGAAISLGQAIVRQLPTLLQVFWIDVLFTLFTDRRQRAFELLSKTRVVRMASERSPAAS